MRIFVVKMDDGYFKSISPTGRVVTAPTYINAQFFGEAELQELMEDPTLRTGQIMEVDISEPRPYKNLDYVSMGMRAVEMVGAKADAVTVTRWYDKNGWPTSEEDFTKKVSQLTLDLCQEAMS